jgi:hypothetical protein
MNQREVFEVSLIVLGAKTGLLNTLFLLRVCLSSKLTFFALEAANETTFPRVVCTETTHTGIVYYSRATTTTYSTTTPFKP